MSTRDWHPLFRSLGGSRKFARLPDDEARIFYALLGGACDYWGRAEADCDHLDLEVWPGLRRGPEAVQRCLDALAAVGLVVLYDGPDGKRYLAIVDHERRAGQLPHSERRGRSQCPDPPGFVCPRRWMQRHKRTSPWVFADDYSGDQSGLVRTTPDKSGQTPVENLFVRTSPARGEEREQLGTSSPPPDLGRVPAATGARPRPARAGRAPSTPPPSSSTGKVVLATRCCPHCAGPVALQVQPHPEPTFGCERHPAHATAGVLAPVCRDKPRSACRSYLGPAEAFGPRPCALCAARAAVPLAAAEDGA